MSENNDQPVDPWAPPNQDGVELSKPTPPTVHDQPTMMSMPGAELPPPPAAPGGGFGYPTTPSVPSAMPTPAAGTPGYGYPPASPVPAPSPYPGYGAGYSGQPGWGQQPSNGLGTAAMVLGIIAVAGFCAYGLGSILGILALIFGVIGLKKANRGEATNRGMAIAGIVLGAIGTVISAVFLGFIIWAIAQDAKDPYDSTTDPWDTSLVVDVRG
ncbi:DUF4190 domain-containing protein [Streptomyces sp. NPDC048623]|uniref:DUF4190 domain-containing protein n=1 Tax=Streptomyces sp. NPDC048623 TaxID=3155761 RepID=UPI00343EF06E